MTLLLSLHHHSCAAQSILPVEKLIFPRIQSGEWSYFNPVAHEDSIFTLSQVHGLLMRIIPLDWLLTIVCMLPGGGDCQFSFRHGVLVLMDRTDWTMAAANRYSFNGERI